MAFVAFMAADSKNLSSLPIAGAGSIFPRILARSTLRRGRRIYIYIYIYVCIYIYVYLEREGERERERESEREREGEREREREGERERERERGAEKFHRWSPLSRLKKMKRKSSPVEPAESKAH